VSNAWSLTWTNSGTTPVSVLSNLWPVEYGYFLATTLTNNNTGSDLTNLVVTIAKKPVRSGP